MVAKTLLAWTRPRRTPPSAAAAAAAAKAAEEAAAAADAWAETKRPTETAAPRGPPTDANDRSTNRDRAGDTAEVSVVVSRGRRSARTFESGGGVSSTAKAVRASPSPDVATLQSLLDANPNDAVSAGDGIAAEYWTPIPESERAASSSFEESDDGGYAPTEWIQNIRKSRRRASSHRARHETRQEARREARGDGTHPGSKARILATRRRPRSV